MKRKITHLYHNGDNEGSSFKITEDIEEYNLREEIRDSFIDYIRKLLNFIMRLK
jgi:hypothetical protein